MAVSVNVTAFPQCLPVKRVERYLEFGWRRHAPDIDSDPLQDFLAMLPTLSRRVSDLFDGEFDLLVVGGGITGACAAWDAALRGLSVALIDSHDFASGASSNSLKLLHGGLRYLRRGLPREARDGVRERRAWLRIAPHLVEPIPVLVPAYRGSMQNPLAIRLLLAANDAVSWDRNRGVGKDRAIRPARMLSRTEVLAIAPALEQANLSGGGLFHDAQIRNTERLVLELVAAAAAAGAVVANHVEFERSMLDRGVLVGAELRDSLSGRAGNLRTRAIINAAGSNAPIVIQRLLHSVAVPAARHSLAMNVMIKPRGLRVAIAFNSLQTGNQARRQLLWVPWRDREILGTYHRTVDTSTDGRAVEHSDVTAFIDEVNRALPTLQLEAADVVLVHGGFLPLDPTHERGGLGLLQRHRIVDHAADGAAGAVSLISVKYTMARLAAQEAVDAVQRRLGHRRTACRTAITRLAVAPESVAACQTEALQRCGAWLGADIIEHLVRTHGTHYQRILDYRHETPSWAERVHAASPVIQAELIHGIREEMAQSADDLLYRRTELGARGIFDDAVSERIGAVVARELGSNTAPPVTRPPLRWHGRVRPADS